MPVDAALTGTSLSIDFPGLEANLLTGSQASATWFPLASRGSCFFYATTTAFEGIEAGRVAVATITMLPTVVAVVVVIDIFCVPSGAVLVRASTLLSWKDR